MDTKTLEQAIKIKRDLDEIQSIIDETTSDGFSIMVSVTSGSGEWKKEFPKYTHSFIKTALCNAHKKGLEELKKIINNMEKLHKLKEEVKPYFDADYHERKMELGSWKCAGITENALEEIKRVVVAVGVVESKDSKKIRHWNQKNGGDIYFTLNVKDISMSEFNNFSDKKDFIAEKFEEIVNEIFNNI